MWNVTDTGSGPAILWIHGFPLASAMFESQLQIGGLRHLVPDLPGFGRSEPEGDQLSMDEYARGILGILDQRGIEQAIVAGFSMGGYIALALARLAPHRLRALILIDTRETADTEKVRSERFETIEKVRREGVVPVADAMLPKMLTDAAPQAMRDRVREMMVSASADGVIAALRAMASRSDSTELLPSIGVPALVIVGDNDPITPPADAERMASALPDATLVLIPGAAHLSNVENAAAVNRAIEEFVTGLRAVDY